LRFGLIAAVLFFSCAGASAGTLTWTISGVTFNDGGTASGTFDYDADTDTFSNIDITTTAGTVFGASTYTSLAGAYPSSPDLVYLQTTTGTIRLFDFGTSANMTDGGGIIPLALDPLSGGTAGEDNCYNGTCTLVYSSPIRYSTTGTVSAPTSGAAPEPASFVLLIGGLGGLGVLALRRRYGARR